MRSNRGNNESMGFNDRTRKASPNYPVCAILSLCNEERRERHDCYDRKPIAHLGRGCWHTQNVCKDCQEVYQSRQNRGHPGRQPLPSAARGTRPLSGQEYKTRSRRADINKATFWWQWTTNKFTAVNLPLTDSAPAGVSLVTRCPFVSIPKASKGCQWLHRTNWVRVESLCVSMKDRYRRYYNPQTVSNRFAPGERIEWKNLMWEGGAAYIDIEWNKIYGTACLDQDDSDCDESTIIECATGIIKKIMPLMVIIAIDHPHKEVKNARLDKRMLARLVLDQELKKTIEASIILPGHKPIPTPKPTPRHNKNLKPKMPKQVVPKELDTTPHDLYRIKDPRDKAVFYVGISKNIQKRKRRHLACAGLNFNLNLRIQAILQCGLIPEMEIIEKDIPGVERAREREKYWINYYNKRGDKLTNIAGMDSTKA